VFVTALRSALAMTLFVPRMKEIRQPDARRAVIFPSLGCLAVGAFLLAVGAGLGWYFPIALFVGGLVGVTLGGFVGAQGRPLVRSAFWLSTMGMLAATTIISLNHNGPDPVLYLTGDAVSVTVGIAAAFAMHRARSTAARNE
jgi:hypothetical protein